MDMKHNVFIKQKSGMGHFVFSCDPIYTPHTANKVLANMVSLDHLLWWVNNTLLLLIFKGLINIPFGW